MYYVYLINSIDYPEKIYIGYTKDLNKRLQTHNSGGSVYTAKNKPWELVVCIGFKNKGAAIDFERYLKSQSGRAFAVKRFLK